MKLYVLDNMFNIVGIVEGFKSLIWIRKYKTYGTFKMEIDYSDEWNELLQKDYILYKSNGEAAFIETKITDTLENTGREIITVQGKFITHFVYRRIVQGTMTLLDWSEICMKNVVDQQCVTTTPERVIPNLEIEEQQGYMEETNQQVSYKNVGLVLEEIAEVSGLGYLIHLDLKERKLIFKVYKGIDRTIHQDVRAPCIFSREFENVLSQRYETSNVDYANVTLVAGDGEGEERTTLILGNATGLNRYELYTNAADISRQIETEDAETGEKITTDMTDEEYNKLLKERGNQKLVEHDEKVAFESVINTKANLVYREDYDLGDKVTVRDRRRGITEDTVIQQIQETYENGKQTITVTFGDGIPQLASKLKRKLGD
jgi:hypothetical protein